VHSGPLETRNRKLPRDASRNSCSVSELSSVSGPAAATSGSGVQPLAASYATIGLAAGVVAS
jgi:hypothetical protein